MTGSSSNLSPSRPPPRPAHASLPLLRPYREADLPALHALDQVCFPPGIAYSRAELRAFLNHPSSFTAVACEGIHPLGFAIVRPRRMRLTSELHLLTIDVAPAMRRQGIGGLLMEWSIRQARQLGSCAITLEVAVDNTAAQGFYAAYGFRPEATIPGYYNGVLDAFSMRLPLASAQRQGSLRVF